MLCLGGSERLKISSESEEMLNLCRLPRSSMNEPYRRRRHRIYPGYGCRI